MRIEAIANYVLAGGFGNRLNPLTETQPKPLLPIGKQRKCIDFALIQSEKAGISTIVAGYYGFNQIETYLKNIGYLGVLVRDTNLVGDGSLAEHLDLLGSYDLKCIILSPADHVHDIDYEQLIKTHLQKEAKATLAVISPTTDDNHVVYVDHDGKVISYQNVPDNYAFSFHAIGVYCLDFGELFKRIDSVSSTKRNKIDVREIFIQLIKEGSAYAYFHPGYWRDIGTLDRYYEENMRTAQPGEKNVIIGDNQISRSAFLENCLILGEVTVSDGVTLSNAIVDKGSHLEKGYLDDKTMFFITEKGRKILSLKKRKTIIL